MRLSSRFLISGTAPNVTLGKQNINDAGLPHFHSLYINLKKIDYNTKQDSLILIIIYIANYCLRLLQVICTYFQLQKKFL